MLLCLAKSVIWKWICELSGTSLLDLLVPRLFSPVFPQCLYCQITQCQFYLLKFNKGKGRILPLRGNNRVTCREAALQRRTWEHWWRTNSP